MLVMSPLSPEKHLWLPGAIDRAQSCNQIGTHQVSNHLKTPYTLFRRITHLPPKVSPHQAE